MAIEILYFQKTLIESPIISYRPFMDKQKHQKAYNQAKNERCKKSYGHIVYTFHNIGSYHILLAIGF